MYLVNGESTYQCESCRMIQCAGRSDDTPHYSTPEADYDSDIVACSNLDMNLRAQLESIHTNGTCTNTLIEKLVNVVLKLSDEIRVLGKDNENLNIRLDHVSEPECCCRMSTTLGAICHGALPLAAKASEPKSYRDVLTACFMSSVFYLGNTNNSQGVHMTSAYDLVHEAGICDDEFSMVVKKMNNLAIFPILPIQRYIRSWVHKFPA